MPMVDDNTGEVIREVIRTEEKFIPKLVEEKKPMLSADLDAQNHDIKSVRNIDAETINGVSLFDWINELIRKLESALDARFSNRGHRHSVEEVDGVEEMVARKTKGFQREGEYATKDHIHTASQIVGLTEMIRNESDKDRKAVEIRLDSQKVFLDKTMTGIAKIVDNKLDKEVANNMAKALTDVRKDFAAYKKDSEGRMDVYSQRIAALEAAQKEDDKPEKEELVLKVYGAEDFLVPSKLDGMKITDIVGISTTEKEVDVEVKHRDQRIGLDYVVKTDEVISLYTPPTPTFVRITFHGQ